LINVRFAAESGHSLRRSECPLWARSGHPDYFRSCLDRPNMISGARVILTGAVMKAPQWYDALAPRGAVIAGVVGLAVVWSLTYYAFHAGYVFWGYSPPQWKNIGTAVDLVGFAVPYWLVKWLAKRQ
jgi:hypothetical protein